MTENIRVSVSRDDHSQDSRTYTIDYFLDLMEKLRESDTTGNMKWAICDNIATALSNNPNLDTAHLERILSITHEHTHRDTLKIILKRKDRQKFIAQVFSIIESSEDSFTVYLLGTAILFDGGLEDYHARVMKALTGLRDRRDYNVQLKEFLIGPCISYQFFIRDMLKNVASVEEAEKWLGEYDQLEELFLLRENQVSGNCIQDPVKKDEHRKRVRERERNNMYRSLAGNRSLPLDYLKRFFDYAETVSDEPSKVSFWELLLSNPQIAPGDYREFFETKKRQLRNKNLVTSLIMALASNPEHFRMYFDYIIKYVESKPISRYGLLSRLIENPGLDSSELDRLLDIVCRREYGPDMKDLDSILRQQGWALTFLLNRKDLSEEHHAMVRGQVIRFLDMIGSDGFYEKHRFVKRAYIYNDYIVDFNLLDIMSKVRLDEEFVNHIIDFAAKKDNGGLLVSGLLPNPCLTQECYDRILVILENQYIGREDRFLTSQRTPFCAEKVYDLWPASQYVR